jgi:homoserine dehydrogenase
MSLSTPSVLESPPSRDASLSSGPSPTVTTLHLIGAGKVGRAFLRRLAASSLPVRVVGVSDRSATVFSPVGLDGSAIAGWKEAGRPLAAHPRAAALSLELALAVANALVVVDASDSSLEPEARDAAIERTLSLLRRGVEVVLAAKTPLLAPLGELESARASRGERARLRFHAALGGAGRSLAAELDELRATTASIDCVPNATTTAIVTALEGGRSLGEGLREARALGLLEHDAEQDLDGRDAALKLALVARLVLRGGFAATLPDDLLGSIERPDVRDLDPELLRERRARGATTRLVGRAARDGSSTLRFEEVASGSPLAVPASRVVYGFRRADGATRLHVGGGVGAEATAAALAEDVAAIGAEIRR